MRPIKFRAWSKHDNRMYEQPLELTLWDDDSISIHHGGITVEDDELMQYTGLKDKNGKEIYEGDIVMYYEFPIPVPPKGMTYMNPIEPKGEKLEVFFDKGKFEPFYQYTADGEPEIFPSQCEIIGNVHENPELLEEAKP